MSAAEFESRLYGASDIAHIVLTFDNNKLVNPLCGQLDDDLVGFERELGVHICSRVNQLTIKCSATSVEQECCALDHLYAILQKGG